jgi:hypothetical protein
LKGTLNNTQPVSRIQCAESTRLKKVQSSEAEKGGALPTANHSPPVRSSYSTATKNFGAKHITPTRPPTKRNKAGQARGLNGNNDMSDPNEALAMQTAGDGTPSGNAGGGAPLPAITFSHPDLKRTLKDLLVADEVSDSDVEMIERASVYEDRLDGTDNAEAVDPDMCVECGDQVPCAILLS